MTPSDLLIKQIRIPSKEKDDSYDVYISHGRIKTISQCINDDSLHNLNEINIIDGDNNYLLPGFIDGHVHLILDGSASILDFVKNTTIHTYEKLVKKQALLSLQNGITTLRDMGDVHFIIPKLKMKLTQEKQTGPRLFCAGHMISADKGHVHTISKQIKNNDELKQTIIDQKQGGADFIKLIVSGGILTPNQYPLNTELNHDLISYAINISKKLGLKCSVHAYSDHDIKNCIHHSLWSIEHGSWASDESLKVIKTNQIYFLPTIKAAYSIIDHKDCLPQYMVSNAEDVLNQTKKLLPQIVKEKVQLVMGTDSGTPFNFHGDNLLELRLMEEYGIPLDLVMKSSTITAANMLGLNHQIGKIKEGFFADLLITKHNPFDNLKSFINDKKTVIYNGSLVGID